MSWYTDAELFIYQSIWDWSPGYFISRITKKYNVPLQNGDIRHVEALDFSKHLCLGNNLHKESDYDALKSILARNSYGVNRGKIMHVNCQGLVVYRNFYNGTGTWSREVEITSIINSLPSTIINPSENRVVEEKISELVAEVSSLKDIVMCLQAQVSDLTAKLQECRVAGGGSVEPWMSGCTVPSNWVPFEELDVLNIPQDAPLTITDAPEFGEYAGTNVEAKHFRQGSYLIVVVNVADLNPNNGKARFDPDVWCSISNAGNHFAARKPSVI